MDYKEKFEDFLDKMQGLLDNAKKQGHIIIRVEDLENTLTELKGSEDERIRKSLIEYFRWNVQQLLNDFSNKEVVVWLEKQGKLVNSLSKGLDNAHERIDELIQKNNELCLKLEKQGEPNPYSGISLDYNGHTWGMCARDDGVDILLDKQLFKHLEKQSEQKIPVLDFKAKDWYVSKVDGKIHNIYNSVDKVEPKFHEGDIIQFNGFGHNRYTIKNVCGLSHYINTIGEKMDMSYTDANFEVIEDSDKNKLCRAWSEEDDYNVQCLVAKANCDIQKGNVGRNEELIDWLKSLRNRVKSQPDMVEALRTEYEKGRADTLSEMKSSWSEEDETKMHTALAFIKSEFPKEGNEEIMEDTIEWLKSLKQRIGG